MNDEARYLEGGTETDWLEGHTEQDRHADCVAGRQADDPCNCNGCWCCQGGVAGCTCDVDWDRLFEATR